MLSGLSSACSELVPLEVIDLLEHGAPPLVQRKPRHQYVGDRANAQRIQHGANAHDAAERPTGGQHNHRNPAVNQSILEQTGCSAM